MSKIKDGGPAFASGMVRKSRERPHDPGSNFFVSDIAEPKNTGMTLRDFFAAKALSTAIGYGDMSTWSYEDIAKHVYGVADAMIKARES